MSKRCQNVKKMSNCQKDVKLSKKKPNVKKSSIETVQEVHKKKLHNEVHTYWRQFWHQIWRSPKLVKILSCTFWGFLVTIIFDVKIDVNMCEPHYANIYFLWTSSIVHVFDFLTFDIFLTIWHLFDNLTHYLNLVTCVMGWGGISYMSVSKSQKGVKLSKRCQVSIYALCMTSHL